jgi:hypothetical protein
VLVLEVFFAGLWNLSAAQLRGGEKFAALDVETPQRSLE